MPNGGELKIAISKTPAGGQVVFQDNGIGMSPEEQEQIFQPFNSQFSTGLGLGLTIIFQIMEDHQGRISFESEKGKGTKAILFFPPFDQEPGPDLLAYAHEPSRSVPVSQLNG
jgi:signal transduction histidine kinase